MSSDRGRDRLGRGLSALLGEHLDGPEVSDGEVRTVPVRAIVANPFQPRREFSAEDLEDLQASIEENGLLQPLVVRPAPGARGKFELVAGERRFRSVLGRSINEEIARLRVERAKRLLVESNTRMKHLAAEAGFRDAMQMCTVFKRVEGITPSEYRRRRRME